MTPQTQITKMIIGRDSHGNLPHPDFVAFMCQSLDMHLVNKDDEFYNHEVLHYQFHLILY